MPLPGKEGTGPSALVTPEVKTASEMYYEDTTVDYIRRYVFFMHHNNCIKTKYVEIWTRFYQSIGPQNVRNFSYSSVRIRWIKLSNLASFIYIAGYLNVRKMSKMLIFQIFVGALLLILYYPHSPLEIWSQSQSIRDYGETQEVQKITYFIKGIPRYRPQMGPKDSICWKIFSGKVSRINVVIFRGYSQLRPSAKVFCYYH